MAGKSGNRKHGRNLRKPGKKAYTADPSRPLEGKLRNIMRNNPIRLTHANGEPTKTRWSKLETISKEKAEKIRKADQLKVSIR